MTDSDFVDTTGLPEDLPEESAGVRPNVPWAAAVAVLSAVVVAAVAALVFSWTSDAGWQMLIALCLLGIGLVITVQAKDPDRPRTRALGQPVLAGIGVGAVVLGAILVGGAILAVATPEPPRPPPGAPAVIAFLYLPLAFVLLMLVVGGFAAGIVGLGLVVPLTVVLVLAEAGVAAGALAIVMLVAAIVLTVTVVAVPAEARSGRLAGIAGAMAASFAVGAGTSPFGSLASARTDAARESGAAAGTLAPWLMVVVLAGGIAAAAILAIMAVARRDVATGLVAASVFALPPTALYARVIDPDILTPAILGLTAVPVLMAVIAVLALVSAPARATVARVVRLDLAGAKPFLAAIGVAAVVFAVRVLPLFEWPARLEGILKLAVLITAGLLALWIPGMSGAVLGGVTIVALHLGSPWYRLIGGGELVDVAGYRWIAGITLLVAAVATVAILRRHFRPGVAAACAYTLAGALAFLLWALLDPELPFTDIDAGQFMPMAVLVGPVLLLGVPAAIMALRGRDTVAAAGQAAGAVLLVAVALIPISTLLFEAANERAFEVVGPIMVLTPTDVALTSASIGEPTSGVYLGIGLVMLLALVLLGSVVRRPSAPLAAAAGLAAVVAAQTVTLGTLEASGIDAADRLVLWLVLVAVVIGIAGLVSTAVARRRTSS